MSLRAFVAAAYALMVRTYAGIPGKTLLEAIDLANETFGIEKKPELKEAEVGAKNAAAVSQLNAQMRGLG